MLRYFQKDTIGQYLTLIVLLLLIRLPFWIYGVPLTLPEVRWMSFSEAITSGGIPYQNYWDDISPLSALIQWILYLIVGKNPTGYQIASMILIAFQALRWNRILYKSNVFNERTMLPAFLYIILAHLFFDCISLSPMMIATTFILLAFGHIFSHLNESATRNSIFDIGLYLSLATLCYVPSFLFVAVPIVGFLLFTGTKLKDYILLGFSFLAPIIILYILFLMMGADYFFVTNVFGFLFSEITLYYMNVRSIATIIAIPILFLSLAIFNTFQVRKYSNYQVRCQQLMLISFFVQIVMILLHREISIFIFLSFLPLFSFFFTHFYNNLKSKILGNLLLLMQMMLVFLGLYGPLWLKTPPKLAKYDRYRVDMDLLVADKISAKRQKSLEGKHVLIFGNNLSEYHWSHATTPYYNWRLAQNHFAYLNKYNIDVDILHQFSKNPPDIIIDKRDFAPTLFKRLPALQRRYTFDPKHQWYVLKR